MKIAWTAMFLVGMAGFALAADGGGDEKKPAPPAAGVIDQGDRINKLEKEIQQLKTENAARQLGLPVEMALEEQDKAAPKPPDAEFKVSFTDGFHMKTADGNFDLHVGGRWLEEYRYTFGRGVAGAGRTSTNTFYAREAFISVDGTLFHDFGFKLNGDFSQPQTGAVATGAPAGTTVSTGAIVEEAFVEWKAWKEFRVMFGSFKAPLSFEITDSPRFAEFIQRSPLARFMPNIDYGIQVYGSFADGVLNYQAAVMNGRSHLANTGRGNIDDNDGKEYDLRISTGPFAGDKESPLKNLRVGVYGSYAREGQGIATTVTGLPGNISTNELAVNYFQFANAANYLFHGQRSRIGFELTYAYGPLLVRGEWAERMDNVFLIAGPQNFLLRTQGYYAETTFVLTGEERLPNARIVPQHNLSLSDGGFGAVELAVRYGGVNMDNGVLTALGATSAGNANGARSLTLGVNWWLCQNVRIMLNFVKESYDGAIPLPGAGVVANRNHAEGILMRFQVDF